MIKAYQLLNLDNKPPSKYVYIKKFKDADYSKIYSIYLCVGRIKIEIVVIPSFSHFHLLCFYSTLFMQAEHT